MRSSKIDESPVDFGLVSTYVPLVSIISRALALVCAIDLARPWLVSDDRVLPLALAIIVYFDAHITRHDALFRTCGFLVPPALAALTMHGSTQPTCNYISMTILHWTCGVAWALLSTLSFIFYIRYKRCVLSTTTSCVLLCTLGFFDTTTRCRYILLPELLFKTLAFYMCCMTSLHLNSIVEGLDRNTHALLVLHTNLHTLHVHPIIVVASSLIIFTVCLRMFIADKQTALPTSHSHTQSSLPTSGSDDEELLRRARAQSKAPSS